jgi:hypothetical protein
VPTKLIEVLKSLENKDICLFNAARIFGIDIKDLTKAVKEEDPVLLALLKLVDIYPWLIKVANTDFNEKEAKRIMIHSAVDVFIDKDKE